MTSKAKVDELVAARAALVSDLEALEARILPVRGAQDLSQCAVVQMHAFVAELAAAGVSANILGRARSAAVTSKSPSPARQQPAMGLADSKTDEDILLAIDAYGKRHAATPVHGRLGYCPCNGVIVVLAAMALIEAPRQ